MLETLNQILLAMHRGGWILLVIVFFAAYILLANDKHRGFSISQQIARFFYIVLIISGVYNLFYLASVAEIFPWNYAAKGIISIWVIYLMETILGKKNRGELAGSVRTYYWLQFIISLVVVVLIGFEVILAV
ncbi:hypothetical protein HNR44_000309 [Geomicrobium halophilum]|uniref:DUF1516 family protein n=1 Tax=Geomicrobium halophilum TaxID=549000 RepID=A0A841PHU6_9BACL|nr:DUF1516 family protein [Geomicrobium halophilum]MBB6448360.1 hypothetical protein [Geomicrobium halophilum]